MTNCAWKLITYYKFHSIYAAGDWKIQVAIKSIFWERGGTKLQNSICYESPRNFWKTASGTGWDSLGRPEQGQEMDSMVFVGPFQDILQFCDQYYHSRWYCWAKLHLCHRSKAKPISTFNRKYTSCPVLSCVSHSKEHTKWQEAIKDFFLLDVIHPF